MTRLFAPALIAGSALLVGPAPLAAAPGGTLGTLLLGEFVCELPGNAEGPVGVPVPDEDFTVLNASSYRTATGSGNYLLLGDRLIMTSGPLRDAQYHRISEKFLRKLDASGKDSRLRCVLRVANNDRQK
jgi:hypothetical protein